MKLFSTEQVSKYHPDKYADQISDAVLDACLVGDKRSHVACETLVKGKTVVLAGEITTAAQVDYEAIVHRVAKKLGYEVEEIINLISQQSPEINAAVSRLGEVGAGDQGMMYGYATRETESRLPYGFDLANRIIRFIENDVDLNPSSPYKGDAKCQVTVDLDENGADSVKKVLVSVCHEQMYDIAYIRDYTLKLLSELGLPESVEWIINPAGEWTIGGPIADCGLTGRKIVCDQYGGYCPVGGGAFSGKDPTKVDRSGAYMARQIACELLDVFGVDTAEVQLAYAIGRAEPMSISVKTTPVEASEYIEQWIRAKYDLSPSGIIKTLDLLEPKYELLAEGCHYI